MHHLADNGSRSDDGNLYDKIVELLWMIPWQRRHLRPALHLEHANGIGTLQRAINLFVFRQLSQIHSLTVMLVESVPDNP